MATTKSKWKKALKISLITIVSLILFVLILIGVVLNIVVTPTKLTPIVDKVAVDFLNAEVEFKEVDLTFFSTFPDLVLEIRGLDIISKVFVDSNKIADFQKKDSLLSIDLCQITIKPIAYLRKKEIIIKNLSLEKPTIYAYIDKDGMANWDIFIASSTEEDTIDKDISASSFISDINFRNIALKNASLVFDDRSTELYTQLSGVNLELDGSLASRKSNIDLNLSTDNLLFWYENNLLVKKLKLEVETELAVDRDSMLYTLGETILTVNGIGFGVEGWFRGDTLNKTLIIDLKYGVGVPSLKTLLDLVPEAFLDKSNDIDVRGDVLCRGEIKGVYGKKRVPLITSELKIQNGYIAYKGMPSHIDTLEVNIQTLVDFQKQQTSFFYINKLYVKGTGVNIDIEASVNDLLSNPRIKADLKTVVDLQELTNIFPLSDGVICKGKTDVNLRGDILLKDIKTANYGNFKLNGNCRLNQIEFFIPKDSIDIKLNSAALLFASNIENKKTIQKKDLFNGIVGYSGLNIDIKNIINLLMDTTYLHFQTSPLRDTTTIVSMRSSLKLGRTRFVVRDTLLLALDRAYVKAVLSPWKNNKKIPQLNANINVDSLKVGLLANRLELAKANIELEAVRGTENVKIWNPTLLIDFVDMKAYTPLFPLPIVMLGTQLVYKEEEMFLDSAAIRIGESDMHISGRIKNVYKSMIGQDTLRGELSIASKRINCNQLMRALNAGNQYAAKVSAGYRETVNTDIVIDEILEVVDTVENGNIPFVVIPSRVNFVFQTNIDEVLFGEMQLYNIHGEVVIRNQCVELSDLSLRSMAANMRTTAIYRAKDTSSAYIGFSLYMYDIEIDSLSIMIPAFDSLLPMLNSFAGDVDFNIAGDANLNSEMIIDLKSIRGAAYLDGQDLVLMDGEIFAEISKMLKFKNKRRNAIDSISVNLKIQDGAIEIFPFLLTIDRYQVAVGGVHNLDMSFAYHISILKSPIPFRVGLNITGNTEDMKFRLGKVQYKDLFIPSRRAEIDTAQLNLQKRIRQMVRELQ